MSSCRCSTPSFLQGATRGYLLTRVIDVVLAFTTVAVHFRPTAFPRTKGSAFAPLSAQIRPRGCNLGIRARWFCAAARDGKPQHARAGYGGFEGLASTIDASAETCRALLQWLDRQVAPIHGLQQCFGVHRIGIRLQLRV
jgi:hypothetical protein